MVATLKPAKTKKNGSTNGHLPGGNGNGTAKGGYHLSAEELLILRDALAAARDGDFSVRLNPKMEGVLGEIASTYNELAAMNSRMTEGLTTIARVVGREGRMTERMQFAAAKGSWAAGVDAVNSLTDDLVRPTTEVARVIVAVAEGDLSQKMALKIEGQPVKGEFLRIGTAVNTMVDQLSSFAAEVTRVAREVGTEGKLGGQAEVHGVSGTWKDLTENVNQLASNLTNQVRNIAQVTTAVAKGDLSQKITVDVKGEILELKDTINTMVDQLRAFADEVTRVAREVGTEGKLGGQAEVPGVSGTWKDLTENVNQLASNLTNQVRNIAQVTTAVAEGDLSQKITVDAKGEVAALAQTINTMVDQLRSFAAEVTRVAREVGTEGKLGGQAQVEGVSGTWKDLTENVNQLASNLTNQVRNIAQVTTAVAKGDLSQKITVDAKGEVAALAQTINTMVDVLRSFAAEVTRVAREVGTEGRLGGQAQVEGVSGTWKDLTENVNQLASNLTSQVRNIAQVTTAVAKGDLSQKITVDVKGEILELKDTINTMVDQLGSFANEVSRVAKEVGTEGKLGGQAKVEGVSGSWKALTENVNQLASNLTTQVRAIAEVSTAVTQGDLARQITVEAQGEVAELKDNINQMIDNLRDTTQKNAEQDWLKTNLARIGGMLQGQRDITTVSRLIMSEVTPLVGAQFGAFFLADRENTENEVLNLVASYGYATHKSVPRHFLFGEGLVGQAALEKKTLNLRDVPKNYIRIASGLGEAAPANIIVLPIIFEEEVLGVIELASFQQFSPIYRTFLDQMTRTIGVAVNTIIANMRTEALLEQSQRLTHELQIQQDELKRSNSELEAQAKSLTESELLLHQQQQELQQTNREIEAARRSLEEKAEQLALSSKYKSEFLANMSHELRTPLNSVLILAKLLADNNEGNLTDKQKEYARTIYAGGSDLLSLISDILDLSKVEAGKMDISPARIRLSDIRDYVDLTFAPVATEKGLKFTTEIADDIPPHITTDEQRLRQIIKNLLSNAFKFTSEGGVTLLVRKADADKGFSRETLQHADAVIAFSVKDTGIGVSQDKLELIFEAFQQADGTTVRKYGGTGLGLSISREIARLLGGEIQVESRPGEGSTFTLYIPATYQHVEGRLSVEAQTAMREADEMEAIAISRLTGNLMETPPQSEPEEIIEDDRDQIVAGETAVLVAMEDTEKAVACRDLVRGRGERVLVSYRSELALDLARRFRPQAIVIDDTKADGLTLLSRLKHDTSIRHIPVAIITAPEFRQHVLTAGAAMHIDAAGEAVDLNIVLDELHRIRNRQMCRVLVVEDDQAVQFAVGELIGNMGSIEVVAAGSVQEANERLAESEIDCMVLDLGLPDASGLTMLEELKEQERYRNLPIVAYTGRELSREDGDKLQRLAQSIVVKDAHSMERLVDELSLFLHIPESDLPEEQRNMVSRLHNDDMLLKGKKILIVDDDVRNVFALTSVLEDHGLNVVFAENGIKGIERLKENPDVALVLMDIMMPEMDGYETTRAIRNMKEFDRLPIIALTAKAMKGDHEKSIASGASEYITKPVDVDQLLSVMRLWLHR